MHYIFIAKMGGRLKNGTKNTVKPHGKEVIKNKVKK
jgi:hypothetical protein